MIRLEKQQQAYYALHIIMVRARQMAFEQTPHKEIANLFDYVEMLPRFLASAQDETDQFRSYLKTIAECYPICSHALVAFDSESTPEKW